MSKESSSSSSGIGFAGALTIAFIVLKLCNVIDWSWWWVLSPSLISIGIVILVLAVYLAYVVYEDQRDRLRMRKLFKKGDPNEIAAFAEHLQDDLRGKKNFPQKSKFMNKLREVIDKNKSGRQN